MAPGVTATKEPVIHIKITFWGYRCFCGRTSFLIGRWADHGRRALTSDCGIVAGIPPYRALALEGTSLTTDVNICEC